MFCTCKYNVYICCALSVLFNGVFVKNNGVNLLFLKIIF